MIVMADNWSKVKLLLGAIVHGDNSRGETSNPMTLYFPNSIQTEQPRCIPLLVVKHYHKRSQNQEPLTLGYRILE